MDLLCHTNYTPLAPHATEYQRFSRLGFEQTSQSPEHPSACDKTDETEAN
jgi:hypothetical protein